MTDNKKKMDAKIYATPMKMDAKMDTTQETMVDLKTQIGCLASRNEVYVEKWIP
jgi:hypothetical protein